MNESIRFLQYVLKMRHQNTVASCPSENHSFYSRLDVLHFFHSGRNLTKKIIADMFIKKKIQCSLVAQSCLTRRPRRLQPAFPVHHQPLMLTQTHVHWVGDAIQPSHPLSSPSPASNPSQHQCLFQRVNSLHEVAKILA